MNENQKQPKTISINLRTLIFLIVVIIALTATVMLYVPKKLNNDKQEKESNAKEIEKNEVNVVEVVEKDEGERKIEKVQKQDEENIISTSDDTITKSLKTISGVFLPDMDLPSDASQFIFKEDGTVALAGNARMEGTYEFDGKKIKIHFTSGIEPEETVATKIDEYEELDYVDENTIRGQGNSEYYRYVEPTKSDYIGTWKVYRVFPEERKVELYGSLGPSELIINPDGTFFNGADPRSCNSDANNDVNGTYTVEDGSLTLKSYSGEVTSFYFNRNKIGYYYGNDYIILKKWKLY